MQRRSAFIGFVAAGVPLGVTLSFLIASPLVNEVAIGLLFGMFGIGPTLLYVGAGLLIAIVAGFVLGRLKLERWVEPFVFETRLGGQIIDPSVGLTWDDRIQMGSRRSAGSCARSGSLLMDRWVGHDRPLPHPASSEADNARLRDPRLDCPNLQRRNRTGTNRGVRAA